jgi:hypothetical protein
MDMDHYPPLGRLAQLGAQLSAARLRLMGIEDAPLDAGEGLLRAAVVSDWPAVSTLCEQVAAQPSDAADERLVRSARKTRDALQRNPSGAKAKRQLIELMTACREAKLRRRVG